MNWELEILAFYDCIESNPQITDTCICLWHALMYQAKKTGWKREFSVAISTLELRTSLKRGAIYNARNKLRQFGLIDFKERDGNQSSIYKINSLRSDLCSLNEHNHDTITNTITTQCGTQSSHNPEPLNNIYSNNNNNNNIYNTSSNSNKLNNKNNPPIPPLAEISEHEKNISEIIEYLNFKTNKSYGIKITKNREGISARLNDGRTVDELKYVVDVKCEEWLNNSEFDKNLNPITLFRPANFDRYINQKLKNPENPNKRTDGRI